MQPFSLERGEDPHLYPKLYPVGYSFGAHLRLHWFLEGIMFRFSIKCGKPRRKEPDMGPGRDRDERPGLLGGRGRVTRPALYSEEHRQA